VFGNWLILELTLVSLGLFVAAAAAALVSGACNRLAEWVNTDGWRTWALWTRRVAQVFTCLLVVAVIGTMVVIAAAITAYFLRSPG
jgi:hypothetical protein